MRPKRGLTRVSSLSSVVPIPGSPTSASGVDAAQHGSAEKPYSSAKAVSAVGAAPKSSSMMERLNRMKSQATIMASRSKSASTIGGNRKKLQFEESAKGYSGADGLKLWLREVVVYVIWVTCLTASILLSRDTPLLQSHSQFLRDALIADPASLIHSYADFWPFVEKSLLAVFDGSSLLETDEFSSLKTSKLHIRCQR